MQQMMSRNICVSSLFICFLFIGSCQKKGNTSDVEEYVSIIGLLTPKDTIATFSDIGMKKLSDYHFFKLPLRNLEPASKRVVPYAMNSPLFSDYTSKKRFISFPKGSSATYIDDTSVLDFPIGTTIIKNFYYKSGDLKTKNSAVLIETRLLIKEKENSWKTLPYVWNDTQTDAYLYILGKDIDIVLEATNGRTAKNNFTYVVPNINMCKNCHVKGTALTPLGPSPRQLHRDNVYGTISKNQLSYLKENGLISNLVPINSIEPIPNYEDKNLPINKRARAYLDVNCAHCHQEKGSAKTSGLHLAYHQKDLYRIGVDKPPVAAGKGSGNLSYDIVVGKPEESILLYRMKNLAPEVVMPEIGKSLVHKEGVDLIEQWISEMQ
jgi:uncharacterized repeat protein (TIGR03806 family)